MRIVFAFLALSLVWLFPNPDSTDLTVNPTGGQTGTVLAQILWITLLAIGLWATNQRLRALRQQLDFTVLVLVAWCLLTTVDALVPDTSLRRLILTVVAAVIFALMFGGMASMRNLFLVLLAMILVETATKYYFAIELPTLGRHQPIGPEPQLVGLWRGQYSHKNIAGPICVVELAILLGCRRIVSPWILVPLAAVEAVFLVLSGSKTPLFLLGGIIVLARFILSLRNAPAIFATAASAVLFINTVTLASLYSDTAKQLAAKLIGDVTFTGRVELWRFLVNYMTQHSFVGAGFQSFWQVGDLSPAVSEGDSWVTTAAYGHQGFLDLAVMIGIPGLILTLLFVIVRPAIDLAAIRDRSNPYLMTFVILWLFGLLYNGTESSLLNRADATWLFLVAAIVGIRRLRIEGASAKPVAPPARGGQRLRQPVLRRFPRDGMSAGPMAPAGGARPPVARRSDVAPGGIA